MSEQIVTISPVRDDDETFVTADGCPYRHLEYDFVFKSQIMAEQSDEPEIIIENSLQIEIELILESCPYKLVGLDILGFSV